MISIFFASCLLAILLSTSVFGNLAFAQSLPSEILITAKRLNVRCDVSESRLGSVIRGQQFQLQSTEEKMGNALILAQ